MITREGVARSLKPLSQRRAGGGGTAEHQAHTFIVARVPPRRRHYWRQAKGSHPPSKCQGSSVTMRGRCDAVVSLCFVLTHLLLRLVITCFSMFSFLFI